MGEDLFLRAKNINVLKYQNRYTFRKLDSYWINVFKTTVFQQKKHTGKNLI